MKSDTQKEKILKPQKEKFEITGRPAGLVQAHKMIMVEKTREAQIMKLCAQIRFDEKREDRAESQRDERRKKR